MIYIAGPVTGYEDDNQPAFERARERLVRAGVPRSARVARQGYEGPYTVSEDNVVIPHDLTCKGATWTEAMRDCIRELVDADTLIYLPGSQDSRGAKLEMKIARALGIPVYSLEQYLKHLERQRE